MRRMLLLVVAALALGVPGASAEPPAKLFGYAGVDKGDFAANPRSVKSAALPTNTLTLNWNEAADLDFYRRNGQRPILIGDLLFFRVDPAIEGPCAPWSMRLRMDWKKRTDRWLARHGDRLNSEWIAGLAINSESNNGCITPETLQEVARYLIDRGVNRDLLGTGNGVSPGAKPMLPWFPVELGWVAMYDYSHLDPSGPVYQAELSELRSKLASDQRYVLVPKGFFFDWEQGIPRWKLGWSTEKLAGLCREDDQCAGVVVFLWNTVDYSAVDGTGLIGTDRMPQAWPGHRRASDLLLGPSE